MTETMALVTPDSSPAEIDGRLLRLWAEIAFQEAIRDSETTTGDQREAAGAALARLRAEADPLEEAYRICRWTRWWWVPKGHLHREGECSTLYESTDRGLYPPASGLGDVQVVELRGWYVCTVCVPGAPAMKAFRTPGSIAAAEADASGICLNKTPTRGTVNFRYRSPFGSCADCGATGVAITSLGNLRQHPHARKKADAERLARIEDPKLIGAPDGSELRVDRDTIRTVQAAKNAYVRHMEYASWGNTAAEHRTHADQIAEALAAKWGVTVEEVHEQMRPKVERKLKQYKS